MGRRGREVAPVPENLDVEAQQATAAEGVTRDATVHGKAKTWGSRVDGKAKTLGSRVAATHTGWLTPYKALFAACMAVNLTCLGVAAFTPHLQYAARRPSLMCVANILTAVLCRNELFLRILYAAAVACFSAAATPLAVRTGVTTFLQNLGGIHSGCGTASIVWLVYSLVELWHSRWGSSLALVSLLLSIFILALLVLASAAAFPALRHLHHNLFERVHRLAGWTSLALLWALVVLSTIAHKRPRTYLVSQQEFWLTTLLSFLIALPWLCVRRVPVSVTASSPHASIIHFSSSGVKPGLLIRISRSPLSEWHAFGIVSDGAKDHLVIAGVAGDFTEKLVTEPPMHLWIRCLYFSGLPYLAHMFNKVLFVATGSGIGVFLSFLLQSASIKPDVYLIWVAKSIEETYGAHVHDVIQTRCPADKLLVCDTTAMGCRPDIPHLATETALRWGAEVVIATSNPSGTADIIDACDSQGIPAFGPIWDS